ncbi:hypothetical protein [Saccharothrix sp. ST-888]|uniref:hypothetical protein n=1 Tax=Saccharothrix sp. ST-888 TaxID=1427391 RepID=UPI000B01DE04|nr:hypothetical protein [Saccharothrix sp. ST-888]
MSRTRTPRLTLRQGTGRSRQFSWFNDGMHRAVDSSAEGRSDLEPFWPSRQPHLFDQTCPGSPRASRSSAR